jgi:hypothetical protein
MEIGHIYCAAFGKLLGAYIKTSNVTLKHDNDIELFYR